MGSNKKIDEEWIFELIGGRLCLDFVNTLSGKRGSHTSERLDDYRDLVSWSRQLGIFDESEAKALLAQAQPAPERAEKVYRDAIDLREALYRIFTAVAEQREPQPDDLSILNAVLVRSLGSQRLTFQDGRYCLGCLRGENDLDCMLWPVAKSAVDLATSEKELKRVRICEATADDRCSWLFLDETRNRTRRWCSMKDCGNRAKARRFYHRHRASAS
jgi:predicted RNA-binding Zn ribbon-like protein